MCVCFFCACTVRCGGEISGMFFWEKLPRVPVALFGSLPLSAAPKGGGGGGGRHKPACAL